MCSYKVCMMRMVKINVKYICTVDQLLKYDTSNNTYK